MSGLLVDDADVRDEAGWPRRHRDLGRRRLGWLDRRRGRRGRGRLASTADACAIADGLGLAPPLPPKNPVRNSTPRTATSRHGRDEDRRARLWRQARSGDGRCDDGLGRDRRQLRRAALAEDAVGRVHGPAGGADRARPGAAGTGGGGGARRPAGCRRSGSVAAGRRRGTDGVGGGGAGSASFSPVHSRKLPHEPQKLAPASFSKPQVLHVIKTVLPAGQSQRRSECNRSL